MLLRLWRTELKLALTPLLDSKGRAVVLSLTTTCRRVQSNITHSVAHAAEGVGPVRSPAMLAQAGYENSQPGAGEAGGLYLQVTPGGCSGLVDTSLTLENGAEASVDTS